MSTALPEGWADSVLGPTLQDYFGMESWADSDRTDLIGTIITGWGDMLGGNGGTSSGGGSGNSGNGTSSGNGTNSGNGMSSGNSTGNSVSSGNSAQP